ncbi:acyltransferase [Verrucosispora sp. WMMD573]|uniref:acyltransferase family protein n=1 Tax=Verrucosispora sp. WMMD573 TaxID=3015149 RepID=UPI00248AA2E7|nr:acyltransferase [Verrucosispora sp. WMMD573]WBB56590.1 acyltransferase [Verrucosispora sp. WMMD573]
MTTREHTVVESAVGGSAPVGAGTRPVSPGTRLAWADVAKGGCILLVLLWHVIVKDYLQIDWRLDVPVLGAWGTFGELLLPMRMPLFFTISGMFAATAVQRPWRSVARPRAARFLYLYGVWLMIHTAVLALAPDFPTDRASDLGGLLAQLTVTPSNLWYLYALALYFVLAKALRRFPPAVLLVAAGTLSALATAGLVDTPGNRGGLYQNLVFFLAGLYLRRYVLRFADAVTGRRLLLAGAAYALALAAVAATGTARLPGVALLVSVLAVLFGIAVAVRLVRRPAVGEPLAALGRQTLPIYVLHMPVLALLHRLIAEPVAGLDEPVRLALALGFPFSLTVAVLAISLGLHRLLLAVRASWLFDLPGEGSAARRPTSRYAVGGRTARTNGVSLITSEERTCPTLIRPEPARLRSTCRRQPDGWPAGCCVPRCYAHPPSTGCSVSGCC